MISTGHGADKKVVDYVEKYLTYKNTNSDGKTHILVKMKVRN